MENQCKIYEDVNYKFVDFSYILDKIKYGFLDDIEIFEHSYPVKVEGVVFRRYLKHSSLVEVMKTYSYINMSKDNAIVIPNNLQFNSNGLLADDNVFMERVLRVIDASKRSIPLLIKRIDCTFDELNSFLTTGEGIDFLSQLQLDKDKLRKKVCTFEQFKKFAKKEKLTYITDNLIHKIEFKRLFIS